LMRGPAGTSRRGGFFWGFFLATLILFLYIQLIPKRNPTVLRRNLHPAEGQIF
jgi:hypothetical protein